jgi:diguanylate cyclase (GGDEF)-like protein
MASGFHVSSQSNPRVDALVQVYRLIERVQLPDPPLDAIERLAALGLEQDWPDLCSLTHWARVILARFQGTDTRAAICAMLESAERTRDPTLLALALSTAAFDESIEAPTVVPPGIGDALTYAVVLLDDASEFAAHRCAAHIEVALAFHKRGLWELAGHHYDLAELAWAEGSAAVWQPVLRCQRRAIVMNRLEILVEWSCALAEVDDWKAAAAQAVRAIPYARNLDEWEIPSAWMNQVSSYRSLFAALADVPRDVELDAAESSATKAGGLCRATVALARAVRHYRAGEPDRAARLAARSVAAIGFPAPMQLKLLACRLASAGHETPSLARGYAEALVRLRWEARLARDRAVRGAIDADRQQAEHRRLRHQLTTDDLTGLPNRRAYRAYISGLVNRPAPAGAAAGRVAVMMIDVDHFKQINDSFGHAIGDRVLRQLGTILAGHVRAVDLAARLGGDEFVVVLDQVGYEVVEARANAILRSVSDHDWTSLVQGLTVSISVGLCMSAADEMQTGLAQADRCLYEAKRSGRGNIVSAPDGRRAGEGP